VNLKLPAIDLISFWFGFVLATIFWLILLRITKLIPKIRKSSAERRIHQQQMKSASKEHGLRLFALRKAQSFHLASSLFPLDKIFIEPTVITPARFLPASNEESGVNSMYRVLPYTPEVPELVADFPVIKNSLLSILQAGQQYIAVSANPGFGKTTALAGLASQLCENLSPTAKPGYLPVFFDYIKIEQSGENAGSDLLNYLSANVKGISSSTLEDLLLNANSSQRLVILVDGLDRLSLGDLAKATAWIHELQGSYPQAYFVISCDPFLTGDIEEIGFTIFPLSVWGKEEKHQFLHQWKNTWNTLKLAQNNKPRIERAYHWLMQEENPDSPFDLTIKTWLTFNGIAECSTEKARYSSYLNLISGGWLKQPVFEALTLAAEENPFPTITQEKALEVLSLGLESTAEVIPPSSALTSQKSQIFADNEGCDPKDVLSFLVKNHFFEQIFEGKLLFSNANLYACLVSKKNISSPIPAFSEITFSPISRILFENRQISQNNFQEIDSWLSREDPLLRRDHFFALAWLKQTEIGDPLRGKLYKQTAKLLQDASLSIGLRYRFLFALVKSHDPSISTLFTYFASSPDAAVRQISAFALGALHDENTILTLVKLSKDPSLEVQKVACISLNKIWTQSTQSALLDVIFSADESVRTLACELVSFHIPDGYQILQELTTTDNFLARKAAVFGLAHIQQPWVNAIFEKISTEDTQWVVRDAAKFTLEHPLSTVTFLPEKRIPVLENPWTLQKAEVYSVPLPDRGIPTELLYTILEKDTLTNKQIALDYLNRQPTARLIETLAKISTDTESDFREEAVNTLFCLSKRGLNLQEG